MKMTAVIALIVTIGHVNQGHSQLLKDYGLKVAVTSADQKYDFTFLSGLETKRRVGFAVGAFAEWFDNPVFSVITQVEYAQKGMGQEFVVTGPDGPEPLSVRTLYSRLDYLSVPVLGKLRLPSESLTPYIMAGPRVDFLLAYKSDDDAFNSVYDKFKKTAWGGTVGIGLQLDSLLPVSVLAEGRYNFDFADSYKTNFLKVRNTAFDFWLGVVF